MQSKLYDAPGTRTTAMIKSSGSTDLLLDIASAVASAAVGLALLVAVGWLSMRGLVEDPSWFRP